MTPGRKPYVLLLALTLTHSTTTRQNCCSDCFKIRTACSRSVCTCVRVCVCVFVIVLGEPLLNRNLSPALPLNIDSLLHRGAIPAIRLS